ncbi:hypothetical protein VTK56DRAFT_5849 [Thermocarpiscus australiensis]
MAILHHPVNERKLLPSQARSKKAYPVDGADNQDDIVRVCTYHRKDYDLATVVVGPQTSSFIASSLQCPFPSVPIASMGSLSRLPPEIIYEVLRYMDIASILTSRQVNRHSRQVISTLPEYRVTTRYAVDALVALCKTKIASHFTLGDVQTALGVKNCPFCGEFAGFVFLPTLQRCCFPCLQLAPEFNVYRLVRAATEPARPQFSGAFLGHMAWRKRNAADAFGLRPRSRRAIAIPGPCTGTWLQWRYRTSTFALQTNLASSEACAAPDAKSRPRRIRP